MDADGPRRALEALIAQRGEDYAGLSRLIGRNPAYIQQYVKRGSPRALAEADRRTLATYLGVPEALLGGPAEERPRVVPVGAAWRDADLVAVPRIEVAASAGPGALAGEERRGHDLHFPPAMLRALGIGGRSEVSLIRVAGDSMDPTLGDGDDILVDRGDGAAGLRDGIYVLRAEEALIVKRITLKPGGGLSVISDNPRHPSWPDADRRSLDIVGRVLWAGRRIA